VSYRSRPRNGAEVRPEPPQRPRTADSGDSCPMGERRISSDTGVRPIFPAHLRRRESCSASGIAEQTGPKWEEPFSLRPRSPILPPRSVPCRQVREIPFRMRSVTHRAFQWQRARRSKFRPLNQLSPVISGDYLLRRNEFPVLRAMPDDPHGSISALLLLGAQVSQ
jgi:hypothetical protein